MPLHAEQPIMRVEHGSMRTIETRNPENLFGLWSVFARCSPALEDGKRYENLAWRLWSRETFCCQPDHISPPAWSFDRQLSPADEMPELSTSVASDDSQPAATASSSRPHLGRHESVASQTRGKHMTPIDLEKVASFIHERRTIEPLSPKFAQRACPRPQQASTPRPASPPVTARRFVPESSTSTVATTAMGSESVSPPVGSDVSTSTDISSHSVVHGFDPARISTSVRSSTNLAPAPILKNSFAVKPPPSKAEPMRKKQTIFTLGGSSDEDNSSSLEAYSLAQRSSLSDHLRKSGLIRKTTSFKNEVSTRTIQDAASEESEAAGESAIESESEEDSDDNAIEEDDSDEEGWEDEVEDSVPPSVDEKTLFQRVDSKPNLKSHRSLLTSMIHEPQRAQAMQEAALRASAPAIRRSRTCTPNGPSTGNSPQEDGGLMMRQQIPRTQPIIMTTSNVHPPMLSPRTTRRNMLQTELTQSLRQNLLWERQHKNATTNAVNKRAQSAVSIPALRRAMTTNDIKGLDAYPQQNLLKSAALRDGIKNNSSYNDYFDQGLQEYHQKGW